MTVSLGGLVDHRCHGLVLDDLDRHGFEGLMNEAVRESPLGTTLFDSMLGLAVRRRCAPLLDLEPLAPTDAYLVRRTALGAAEVNHRMLAAAGMEEFCVDTGLVDSGMGDIGMGDTGMGDTGVGGTEIEVVADGDLAEADAAYVGGLVARDNARRAHTL